MVMAILLTSRESAWLYIIRLLCCQLYTGVSPKRRNCSIFFIFLFSSLQSGEVQELSALQLSSMSARERNRAKRKARQMARRSSRDVDPLDSR